MVDTSKLGPITEPVRFDWEGAARLSAELRKSASVLEAQIPSRNKLARAALEEWRGVFANQFEDNRMKLCVSDARSLAEAMIKAAEQLDALAEDARNEQNRRDAAKMWASEMATWEANQEKENLLIKGADKIGSIIGKNPDPKPEPYDVPEIKPNLKPIPPPSVGERTP